MSKQTSKSSEEFKSKLELNNLDLLICTFVGSYLFLASQDLSPQHTDIRGFLKFFIFTLILLFKDHGKAHSFDFFILFDR